ncbi:hypothetical protein [Cellulomonas cellasea]|uniref:Lipoprotein n=1 Tax=Cellulomonas cellasea TaxID=43670 RepID=A0A7W4UI71_9CELL|nr:hypothetical protein [Cellulomonas cellasea]MBB2924274.1 hypothetical protein [Cellulomonas cellasea]
MRSSSVLRAAAAALVPVCLVVSGGPAAAHTPTVRCSDIDDDTWRARVAYRQVDADLVVDGRTCRLFHVGVHGDVLVPEGSSLFLENTTVHGDLTSAGSTSLHESSVDGDVVLSTREELALYFSTVRGSVTGTASSVTLWRSTVAQAVDLTLGFYFGLSYSRVGGSATLRPGQFHVEGSTVVGDLGSTGARDGGRMCRSTVHGDLRLSGSGDDLNLAASWQEPCRTTVHGSAHLTDNTGDVLLGRLYVRGDLVCTGNTGPRGVVPVGTASVEGTRSGQCA